MKKTLFLTCLLLALSASLAAAAAGVNLGWGPFCPTASGSAVDQSDPCDGSTGATYEIVGSVRSPIALAAVGAEEMSVDLQEGASTLSDYWQLADENQPGQVNPAGCRGTSSLTGNVGSLGVSAGNGSFPTTFTGCLKFWGASPAGGVNYIAGIGGPNRARLSIKESKSPASAMAAQPSQYGSFVALLDTNHQNGSDPNFPPPAYLCAGCHDGVCIVFNQIILRQPPGTPGGDITLNNQDLRNFVTWQGGQGTTCPAGTPTHRATWGQVKSLYR